MDAGSEDSSAVLFNSVEYGGGPPNLRDGYKKLNAHARLDNLKNVHWDNRNANMNDQISAMYAHPRSTLKFWENAGFSGRGFEIHGRDWPWRSDNWTKQNGWQDNISSVEVIDHIPLEEWKLKCCRGENSQYTNKNLCSKYWMGSAANCGRMNCGDTVSSNIGPAPRIMTDSVCRNWCANNPNDCDAVKIDFCRRHPNSPICKCLNPNSPEYVAEKAKYDEMARKTGKPLITAPRPCWNSSGCNNSDLYDMLITQDIKNTRNNCPDVMQQIMDIEISNSNLQNVTFSQDMKKNDAQTTNVKTGNNYYASSNLSEPNKEVLEPELDWFTILLYIVIILFAIVITTFSGYIVITEFMI